MRSFLYPRAKKEYQYAESEQEGKKNVSLQLSAFLTLLVLSLAVPIILFLLLRASLTDLLRRTLKVQAGVTFYLPSFLLFLFSSSLFSAIGTSFFFELLFLFLGYGLKEA